MYQSVLLIMENIGHLFKVIVVTDRPAYRKNEKRNHEGSDHNLKNRRDSSQNLENTLLQTRSMKWKIHHYKPVQVMMIM